MWSNKVFTCPRTNLIYEATECRKRTHKRVAASGLRREHTTTDITIGADILYVCRLPALMRASDSEMPTTRCIPYRMVKDKKLNSTHETVEPRQ
jgi:hypothetical protein